MFTQPQVAVVADVQPRNQLRTSNAQKHELQSAVLRRQQLLKGVKAGPDSRHDSTHEQEIDPRGILAEVADAGVVIPVDFFGDNAADDVGRGPTGQGHHRTHEKAQGVHGDFFQAQEFSDHDVIQLGRHNHSAASEQTERAEFGELRQVLPVESFREAAEQAETRSAHQEEGYAVRCDVQGHKCIERNPIKKEEGAEDKVAGFLPEFVDPRDEGRSKFPREQGPEDV